MEEHDDRDHQSETSLNLKVQSEQKSRQDRYGDHLSGAAIQDSCTPEDSCSETDDEQGVLIFDKSQDIWTDCGRLWMKQNGKTVGRTAEVKKGRREPKFRNNKEAIDRIKRNKHAKIQVIRTLEYHQMEGNNDEMDNPARYR